MNRIALRPSLAFSSIADSNSRESISLRPVANSSRISTIETLILSTASSESREPIESASRPFREALYTR